MSPVWWFPLASIALNIASAIMFAWSGNLVGTAYWIAAAVLTLCVMIGLTK